MPSFNMMTQWNGIAQRVSAFSRKPSPWDDETPIREELFSVERLEAHARSLAAAQPVSTRTTRGLSLSPRLADNGVVLLSAYRSIVLAIDEYRAITPAAEWLIDNYHVVEKQLLQISTDLPPGYYRQLPKLVTGPFAGYPRVFGLAWAFVAHTDSCFETEIFVSYVNAYQEVQPLTIGELWAVSTTPQIVLIETLLIENLRRLAQEITRGRSARREADSLADRLLGVSGHAAEPASVVFAKRGAEPSPKAFAVQLEHRLRDQDPRVTPALAWLDDQLAKQGMTAETVVRDVHRNQGAANVTVRNLMTSLRVIVEVDWRDLFERTCIVDRVLADGSRFAEMDFATRTQYRAAVEQLARGSRRDELDVARLARNPSREPKGALPPLEQARQEDCGYYLFGGGRQQFEETLGFRRRRVLPKRLTVRLHFNFYAGSIVAMSALLLAAPMIALARGGMGFAQLCILAALGNVPATDAGMALVNRLITHLISPMALPGFELRDGVPEALRTIVAVPTLLTSKDSIAEQVERLETHHLASPEGDLYFAMLSDWVEAKAASADDDAELVDLAREGIDRLDARCGPAPAEPRFLLLHRRRVWNEGEQSWIGGA